MRCGASPSEINFYVNQLNGGQTTRAVVLNNFLRSPEGIGRVVREAQSKHDDPVAAILAAEPGKLLYKGKVIDVARRTTDGYLRGVVRFDGMDDFRGSSLAAVVMLSDGVTTEGEDLVKASKRAAQNSR